MKIKPYNPCLTNILTCRCNKCILIRDMYPINTATALGKSFHPEYLRSSKLERQKSLNTIREAREELDEN